MIALGSKAGGLLGYYLAFRAHLLLIDWKCDPLSIYVDVAHSKAIVKCDAKSIPCDQFKVYAKAGKKRSYLHIKGATVDGNNKVKTCDHKYVIGNISTEDLNRMTWGVQDDSVIVEIPISELRKDIYIRRIE